MKHRKPGTRVFNTYICLLFTLSLFIGSVICTAGSIAGDGGGTGAFQRSYPRLLKLLKKKELKFGAPLFIRIFKQEKELEVWLRGISGRFELLKTYAICTHSGSIGPKLQEGDLQSPEGFYRVAPEAMNPKSKYHLAFNIGYPNSYDNFHERTGGALMIHGRCSSSGCFAMTDYYMDELYTIAEAAFSGGQKKFQVHIFPFRFTDGKMYEYQNSRWLSFWRNLKEGYDFFEKKHLLPEVSVSNGRYVFSAGSE